LKVLLVDDHPLVLSALRELVAGLGTGVRTEGVGSAAQALEMLTLEPDFDLVVLDLHLPDGDGFGLLGQIRLRWPDLPVMVVSGTDRDIDVSRALAMGAMGFAPKRASQETLREALLAVLGGNIYVPPPALRDGALRVAGSTLALRRDAPPRLTKRQGEVLQRLLLGHSNKVIARDLGVSSETVKDHVQGVLRALGVTTRTQAVLMARQWADFDPDVLDSEFGPVP
jgi:DNA-binding NarL/FixJ family response regulator